MPYAHLTIADPQLDDDVRRRLGSGITALLASELAKDRAVTVTHVELVEPDGWLIGGTAPRSGSTAAHLEVTFTAQTNTAEQKSAFIAATHDLIAAELGVVADVVYIVLREAPADSWGWGGHTQDARRRETEAAR